MNEAVVLPPAPEGSVAALDAAADARDVAARWPTYMDAWASLAEAAYAARDDVASYAFARTGYHRGLDGLRAAGWRGTQPVPWEHPTNRGFLRSLHALMRAAAAIGEGVEARRCREFLLQLDPGDHFRVGEIRPADLGGRLPG